MQLWNLFGWFHYWKSLDPLPRFFHSDLALQQVPCPAVLTLSAKLPWKHGRCPVLICLSHCCLSFFRDYMVDNGMLEIPRLYPGDQGTYVCQAQNDIGQNEKDYNLSVGGIVY